MPNIELRGYGEKRAKNLKVEIDYCMRMYGIEKEAITDIVPSRVESCDRNQKPMPYFRLFSSDDNYVPIILKGFQKFGPRQDVEVIASKVMFFTARQIKSGAWRKIFAKKMGFEP